MMWIILGFEFVGWSVFSWICCSNFDEYFFINK